MTMKTSGCSNPHCDGVNCDAAPVTVTINAMTGEASYTSTFTFTQRKNRPNSCLLADGPEMNAVLAPMLKSLMENPGRHVDLCKRTGAITKEEKALKEKLSSAKPGEKKRLTKALENKVAEQAKLKDLIFRTAGSKPPALPWPFLISHLAMLRWLS